MTNGMKIKPTMNRLKLLLFSLLLLTGWVESRAQLTVGPARICDGFAATLKVTYAPTPPRTIQRYEFDLYNDGTNIKTTNSTTDYYIHQYAPGSYKASVKIILDDNSVVNVPAIDVIVYHLPKVDALVMSQDTQCFRGNLYVFKNLSQKNPASPSNPISFFYWNYGDATGDTVFTTADVTHSYNAPITQTTGINVLLSATDDKGCRKDSIFQAFIALKPNIRPDFKWTFISGPCFVSCYEFQNLSTPHPDSIERFKWDFGDGGSYEGYTD